MCVPIYCAVILASSSEARIDVWTAMGAVTGVYLFYKGFRMLQRKRLILDTPSSKIRSASIGLVEVNGLATGPVTITAPVTRFPCYYYRSTVSQLKQSGRNKSWQKVWDESRQVPFYLDDNTGRLLIDPTGADMEIHRDFYEEFRTGLIIRDDVPENVSLFLAARGLAVDHPTRVEEHCIKPKNALFALGTLAENPGITVSAEGVPTVAEAIAAAAAQRTANGIVKPHQSQPLDEVEKHRRELLAASMMGLKEPRAVAAFHTAGENTAQKGDAARPIDEAERHRRELFASSFFGVKPLTNATTVATVSAKPPVRKPDAPIDEAEKHRRELLATALFGVPLPNNVAMPSASGGTAAAAPAPAPVAVNAVSPAASAPQDFDLHPPVVLMKGAHNPQFLISWRSQRDVVAELGWKSMLYIWGGPALSLLSLAILLARLGVF